MSRETLEASIDFWAEQHNQAVLDYDLTAWWQFRRRRNLKKFAIDCKERWVIQQARWARQWLDEIS